MVHAGYILKKFRNTEICILRRIGVSDLTSESTSRGNLQAVISEVLDFILSVYTFIVNKPEKFDTFVLGGMLFATRLRRRIRGAFGGSNVNISSHHTCMHISFDGDIGITQSL